MKQTKGRGSLPASACSCPESPRTALPELPKDPSSCSCTFAPSQPSVTTIPAPETESLASRA